MPGAGSRRRRSGSRWRSDSFSPTMRTAAILPIKSFAKAKQRLRVELPEHDRRALVEAMFADALVALGRVPVLERVIVVSGDRVAQRIAGGYGASVIEDDERGHNTAAIRGVE